MIFVMILIVLGVLALVGYPLVRVRARSDLILDDTENTVNTLIRRKDSSYAAIKELDFDYHTGKLSDEDYQNLYKIYKADALQTIQALDTEKLTEMEQLDAEVEAEIKKMRTGLQPPFDDKRESAGNYCPACGAEYTERDDFCGTCGTQLGKECNKCSVLNTYNAKFCCNCGARLGNYCPQCGHIYHTGVSYCSQCGTALTAKGVHRK
jgi:hypothetical protein